ncbi:MAG: protein kinase [Chitinophagales bacterium]
MIGEIISNYKIISVIGEGGMGTVYLAEHVHIGRKAAIKVLHKKYLSNSNIKERFKHEAATLSQIQHPNIVKLYDYVETNDGLYLIMEYAEGVLLDDYIKKESGPIKEENAIKIMNGLLAGFAYAHSQNIVHRDVKPNNVIISRDFNTVKILDFGIAKIINDNSKNLTKDGTQMGTVYYMSPEQVRGQKVDNRSDIYSLGVTLFQIITGINPYEKITTEFEIYSKITQEDLPNAKSVYPYVSDKIIAVIQKATRKNVAERYKNCEQMIADLKANYQKQVPIVEPVIISKPQPIKPLLPKQQPILVPEPEEKKGTNTGLILGFVIGIIVVIVVAIKFISNPEPPAPLPKASVDLGHYVPDSLMVNILNDTFRYTGWVKEGKADSIGTAIYTNATINGDQYKGKFKNNLKEGHGIYTYANSDIYESSEGTYTNNLLNGTVIVIQKDGEKKEAEYKDDLFVKWK